MSDTFVRYEVRGSTAIVTLDRPERRNALSLDLIESVSEALSRASRDGEIRALILNSSGPVFCAGMDFKETAAHASAPTETTEKLIVAGAQAIADLLDLIHKFPKPTIAALEGDAYGGGAGIAAACDFIIAADSAKIGYPEVKRGLVAAMVLHDLTRQIGDRRARAMLLTGEPMGAPEAFAIGLVHKVVPHGQTLDAALALAAVFLACAPRALQTTKKLLDESSNRPTTLRGPAAVSAAIRVGDEAIEGVQAFLEKREPSWAKPAPANKRSSKSPPET